MTNEVATVGDAHASVEGARASHIDGGEPPPPLPGESPDACPSCGATLVGDYCHDCGEKRPESRDLTLRHFFTEAAQELTSVEHSKLFHTIWALLLRPGFLTNEWIAGRRRLYLKPLNLYLGIFALSLFAYSAYKPVSTYDLGNLLGQQPNGDAMKVFDRLAAKKHTDRDTLFDRIGEKWQHYMSLAPLVLIAGFALVLNVVFFFSRRYFVEHLVFSMHFISFSTLTVVILWPVYFFIGIKQGGANTFIAIFKWLLDVVYSFFAVRAVYGLSNWRTLLASVPLVIGYFASYMIVLICALGLAIISISLS